jgi:hypothetical protein
MTNTLFLQSVITCPNCASAKTETMPTDACRFNGKSLPLWKELPRLAFWVLPSAIGIPLMVYALFQHPLVRPSLNSK